MKTLEAHLRNKEAEKFIADVERLIAKGENIRPFVLRYQKKMNNKYYGGKYWNEVYN